MRELSHVFFFWSPAPTFDQKDPVVVGRIRVGEDGAVVRQPTFHLFQRAQCRRDWLAARAGVVIHHVVGELFFWPAGHDGVMAVLVFRVLPALRYSANVYPHVFSSIIEVAVRTCHGKRYFPRGISAGSPGHIPGAVFRRARTV